jgi:DNA-binding transcriptional LysR family regulator
MLNEHDISLRHLRVLDVLITERSLTRAANVLDTSQPALSKILARLRAHFADPLFVRVGFAMVPTARALEIAEPIRTILATSSTLGPAPAPFDPATSQRAFSLFISDVGALRLSPPLMRRLEREAPGIRIRIIPLDGRQLLPKLEAGEADIAIGAFPGLIQGIRRRKLFLESYVGVVRRHHAFAATPPDRARFLAARHVLVTAHETGHAHAEAERILEATIPEANLGLRVPGFVAAAMAVKRTDMVATMPANLAAYVAAEFDLAIIPAPLDLPRVEIVLSWHERFHRDPANRWIRRVLFEILGKRYSRTSQAA